MKHKNINIKNEIQSIFLLESSQLVFQPVLPRKSPESRKMTQSLEYFPTYGIFEDYNEALEFLRLVGFDVFLEVAPARFQKRELCWENVSFNPAPLYFNSSLCSLQVKLISKIISHSRAFRKKNIEKKRIKNRLFPSPPYSLMQDALKLLALNI